MERVQSVLQALRTGNQRFVEGKMRYPRQDETTRMALTRGQTPRAVVLGCADSRVPPEVIFDQGLGDLFVVRSAGNIPDVYALASIEYAVLVLQTPLLVVLGHTQCGAVRAAIEAARPTPALGALVDAIRPSVEAAETSSVDDIVAVHVRRVAATLPARSEILAQAVADGRLVIVPALYHLGTGVVEWLEMGDWRVGIEDEEGRVCL
nr:carbonic anhydrase [Ardenticatena sp.]